MDERADERAGEKTHALTYIHTRTLTHIWVWGKNLTLLVTEQISILFKLGIYLVGVSVIVSVFVVCSTFASKSSPMNGWMTSWNCLGMVRL